MKPQRAQHIPVNADGGRFDHAAGMTLKTPSAFSTKEKKTRRGEMGGRIQGRAPAQCGESSGDGKMGRLKASLALLSLLAFAATPLCGQNFKEAEYLNQQGGKRRHIIGSITFDATNKAMPLSRCTVMAQKKRNVHRS